MYLSVCPEATSLGRNEAALRNFHTPQFLPVSPEFLNAREQFVRQPEGFLEAEVVLVVVPWQY